MLDQMSEYPAPKGKAAAAEVVQDIRWWSAIKWHTSGYAHLHLSLSAPESEPTLFATALDILTKDPPQYSLAAWSVGGCEDYTEKVMKAMDAKVIPRRRLRGLLRTLALLSRIYSDTVEKRYAPEGAHETAAALQWNPLLRKPPPPPATTTDSD